MTTFSIKTVIVANFNSFSSEVVDYMFQGTTGIRLHGDVKSTRACNFCPLSPPPRTSEFDKGFLILPMYTAFAA